LSTFSACALQRRVPSPNRYMAFAKFCFCKNNKRTIDRGSHCPGGHLSFTDEHCIACPHNHWCVDNFAWQCVSNELASPNSSRHGQCRCAAGFYHEHGACVECLMHNICSNESRRPVGEFDPGLRTLAPSTVLLDDNVCAPGMFRTSRMCKTCPRHFLLP
jgi:hypothetical protein